MQHGRHFAPDFVTGQLLGMDTDSSLEVSDSFPFANNINDELEQEGNLILSIILYIKSIISVNGVKYDELFLKYTLLQKKHALPYKYK